MKVENMQNSSGRAIPYQFIVTDGLVTVFQSYDSIICRKEVFSAAAPKIELNREKWDYSKTTGKYRNQFLGETKKETEKKIKDGTYILTDLNK